ncbi:MFS transporter [Sinosporangium siamense]|uniref:MFS transporter n=1 Tax=Sinosporangium siamense TaxID=1367973 RepID=A0A919V5E1_9ACTN|nr:MFS transporter [Sinosporangium siamense]GII90751.1 MFS transporter [Sinosporangium siamense]
MPQTEPAAGHPHRRRILAALCAALLVMSVSVMAVTIALPPIALELRATTTQLQWITEAMVLALAALLIPMGAAADRYGRRRVLLAGLAVFATASLLAAITRTPGELIAARALMGVGNAMITPSTLSIVRGVFPRSGLPKALAVWGAVASLGVVLGPLTGGLLVEHFGWRSIFLVNAAALLPAAVGVSLVVPASRGRGRTTPDLLGIVLISLGFVALIHTIVEAPRRSGLTTLGTAIVALALLAGFAVHQRRAAHPLLDLRMVAARTFWPAAVAAATGFFTLMGVLFLITQHYQDVRGHSPAAAALLMLPVAAGQLGVAPLIPRLIARYGVRTTAAAGLLGLTLGLAVIHAGLPAEGDWPPVIGLALVAAGNGATVNAASTAMMASAAPDRAGSAAAVNETAFKLGGSIGVAVLGSVVTAHLIAGLAPHRDLIPPGVRAFAAESVTGALHTAHRLGEADGARLAGAARDAFAGGFAQATLLAAGLAVATAALITLALREPYPITGKDKS